MVTVSIITLAYNSMNTIYKTIESILIQDYASIEIVIADDCSSNFDLDGIFEYIENNKGNNIVNYQVYQNAENVGTVKNLNCAIKKCSGQLIMHLSADDMFFNEHIITDIVKEFDDSKCNVLLTRRAAFVDNINNIVKYMPDDYQILRINQIKTPMQEYLGQYIGKFYDMGSGSALYYRKSYIEELGYFDEEYRLWEDGPFFAKSILTSGMLHHNYDIISIYYRLGGVSTGNTSPTLKNDMIKFLYKGIKSGNATGMNLRIMKKWYFNLTSKLNRVFKRLVSCFLFPDVYLYQVIDKVVTKIKYRKYL